MLRIAAYARVSEEEQVRGENIDAQKIEIINYLKSYTEEYIITWYLDDGVSSQTYLNERPQGRKLMAAVMDDKYDQVLVQRVDRLARDDLIQQVIYKLFKDHRIALISIHQRFDLYTPEGQLMATTFGGYASYEYHVMRERLASGRIKNAYKGRWNGGHIPFGYARDKGGNIIVDEANSETYKYIVQLALQGLGANLIRQRLQDLGIKSPTGDDIWSKRTIVYMLRNPFYKGELNYKGIKVENTHPALITSTDFDSSQTLINARGHRGTTNPYHLLSGLIYCDCGKKFAIRYTGKNKARRYCCQHKYETALSCDLPLIDADSLEKVIEEMVLKIAKNPDVLYEAVKQIRGQEQNRELINLEQQIAIIEKDIAKVIKLIRKKDELYAKDILSDDQYDLEIQELYNQERELRDKINSIKTQMAKPEEEELTQKELILAFNSINKYWNKFDAQAKQQAIGKVIKKIIMSPDCVTLDFGTLQRTILPSNIIRGCMVFK